MSLFDQFSSVQIVSLRRRKDRRRQMARELLKLGVTPTFLDAFELSEPGPFLKAGSHGCYLSHLQILEEASANGKSVLILQDDCSFLPAVHTYEMPDCDIFYGSHSEDSDEIIGAHFMGFSQRAAKLAAVYLRDLLNLSFSPDPRASKLSTFNPSIRPPIDGALVWFRRAHPELHTQFALLGVQRSSESDISPRHILDRLSPVSILRRIRRAFE